MGFREFSAQAAPPSPELLALVASARLEVEEQWEEEFVASVAQVVERGWRLTPKQLDVLQKLAAGFYAEQRRNREDGLMEDLYPNKDEGDR